MCSNSLGIDPKSTVQRYVASQKKKVNVQQPNAIHEYNQHMGGVDLMDQNVNTLRVAIRGKKWYSSIITYFLDVAVNNAWQLYREADANPTMDLLAFRCDITLHYLKTYGISNVPTAGSHIMTKKETSRYDRFDMR